MSQIAVIQRFGARLLEAIGIDPASSLVTRLEIVTDVETSVMEARITRLVKSEEADDLIAVLSEYRLVPKG